MPPTTVGCHLPILLRGGRARAGHSLGDPGRPLGRGSLPSGILLQQCGAPRSPYAGGGVLGCGGAHHPTTLRANVPIHEGVNQTVEAW